MAKIQTKEDCVLNFNGTLICALCGKTITSIEDGCTCNAWANAMINLKHIDDANSQIEKYQRIADEQKAHYEEIIETVSARLPESRFKVEQVVAIVPVPPAPETPSEEDGGNGDNGEPTEGGGE